MNLHFCWIELAHLGWPPGLPPDWPLGLPLAHLLPTGLGPWGDGMALLVLQPSQLLLVLGLVLLAAQGGAACCDRLPLLLPGAWLLGGLVGLSMEAELLQALACTALVTAIGLLTALGVRLGARAFLLLGAGTAMPVALVAGSAMAGHQGALAALLGQVVAIAVLAAVLLQPLAPPQPRWLAIGLRVAGSWIAAAGLMMLAWLARHPQ
jgi:hypothetical protein